MNNYTFKTSTFLIVIITILLLFLMNGLTPKFHSVDLSEFDLTSEISSLTGSNLLRQLIWISIFFISFILLFKYPKDWLVLLRNKEMLFFNASTILILISFLFSEHISITLRRSLFYLISSLTVYFLVYLSERRTNFFNSLFYCFIVIVFLDVIAVVFFNGVDTDGNFKGIHGQKNTAGSVYACFFVYFHGKYKISKNKTTFYLFITAFSLMLFSFSKTSIAIALIFVFLWNFKKTFYFITLSAIFLSSFFILFYMLDLFDIPGEFLTGRGYIWTFIKYYNDEFIFNGFGYGSFWGVGEGAENVTYGTGYIQLINSAHNGYVDLLLSGGILLLLMGTLHLVKSLNLILKNLTYSHSYFCGFCLFSLVFSNFTESSLFLVQSYFWILYMASFFCLVNYNYYKR